MRHFFTELYFYKDGLQKSGYTRVPDLEDYKQVPVPYELSANDWKIAEKNILEKYPAVAYIHVIDSRSLDI
jgi:hypothetical protein